MSIVYGGPYPTCTTCGARSVVGERCPSCQPVTRPGTTPTAKPKRPAPNAGGYPARETAPFATATGGDVHFTAGFCRRLRDQPVHRFAGRGDGNGGLVLAPDPAGRALRVDVNGRCRLRAPLAIALEPRTRYPVRIDGDGRIVIEIKETN